MPCQVLDRFGIDSGVDQIRDIRVAQQVRSYRKTDSVHNTRLVPALLPASLQALLICSFLVICLSSEDDLNDLHPDKPITETDHQLVERADASVNIPGAAHVAFGRN